MAVSEVVTDKDVEEMIAQRKTLDDADAEIRLAQRAGVDVSAVQKQSQELRTKLSQMINVYGPGRS